VSLPSRARSSAATLGLLVIAAQACGVEEQVNPFDDPSETTRAPGGDRDPATSSSAGTSSSASTSSDTSGVGGSGGTGGAGGGLGEGGEGGGVASDLPISKVFLILLENHKWAQIKNSPSAPYLNGLLAQGAHAEQYKNPPGLHPSEPNYIWLEAGTAFGITNGLPPAINHQRSTHHLVSLLERTGHTWRSYQEDISGLDCPLVNVKKYAPKHNPMVFFDDVTNTNDPSSPRCIAHVRPYREIDQDLLTNQVADYNFITPNLCNDMHDPCPPLNNGVKQGDLWLANEVPKLLASKAYAEGAAIFITFDEGPNGNDGPIGMIALGKKVKVGYENAIPYTHSSTLRTMQTIFGVYPFLGDAENAVDLGDFFTSFP
jgi:hypothetical protein